MLPWIVKPKENNTTQQKSVCALFLSKEKWRQLGKNQKVENVRTS
jgi:hypothetical protein